MSEIVAVSLAKEATYVKLQARVVDNVTLHIQGKGPYVNRDYGVSCTITNASPSLMAWMRTLETPLASLAKTEQKYFALQARVKGDHYAHYVHFQVSGDEPLNRGYGASFDVDVSNANAVAQFVSKLIVPKISTG